MATATARKQKPKAQLVKVEKVELLAPDRVTQFLARVTKDLTPFIDQQEDMEHVITRLTIKDQASRERASEMRKVVGASEKDACAIVNQTITLAHTLHRSLTSLRGKVQAQAEKNRDSLDAKILEFDDFVAREQERRDREEREKKEKEERERRDRELREAQAETERKQREADEAKQKADELARKAQESANPEDSIRASAAERESERLFDEATTKKTELAFVEEKASSPIDMSHVTAAPIVERPRGESWVDNWKAEVVDRMAFFKFVAGVPADVPIAHPELFNGWMENKSILSAWATAQKGGLSIPGVKVSNDKFMRQSQR